LPSAVADGKVADSCSECRKKNCLNKYEDPQAMKHNDLSPRSLVQPQNSSRSCLPSVGHVFLIRNKLSIEISCQLFLNKQYQRHKYGWETYIMV
jgi:hypothetical protein